jgi:glutathione S-transferase
MTMQLIGMLDSPFVRRVAITMQILGIEYEHRPLSVLRTYDEFRKVNPLVKVPTLVCEDGEMLIDSSLIISHLESVAGRSLMPVGIEDERRALQQIGVALVAMEKIAHRIYETKMRPEEFVYAPWLDRIVEQISSALDWLEESVSGLEDGRWLFGDQMSQADITTAIAWRFAVNSAASVASAVDRPALQAFSDRAEALPEFLACPIG